MSWMTAIMETTKVQWFNGNLLVTDHSQLEETIYQDSQKKFFDNDQDPTTSVGTFNIYFINTHSSNPQVPEGPNLAYS